MFGICLCHALTKRLIQLAFHLYVIFKDEKICSKIKFIARCMIPILNLYICSYIIYNIRNLNSFVRPFRLAWQFSKLHNPKQTKYFIHMTRFSVSLYYYYDDDKTSKSYVNFCCFRAKRYSFGM